MAMTVRAGTWNIHEGKSADGTGQDQTQQLIALLVDTDADLVALQEVPFGRDGESSVLQTISASTQLKYVSGFPLSRSSFHPERCSGLALASRMPHVVVDRTRLPNPNLRISRQRRRWESWDKGIITSRINLPGRSLWASSVHSYPFHDFDRSAADEEFKPIWLALAKAINQIPGTAIVAGDFNTDRRVLLTSLLNGNRLLPCFDGTPTHGRKAVDDILHDVRLDRGRSKVTPNFSDHAYCQADFSFKGDLPMDPAEATRVVMTALNAPPRGMDGLGAAAAAVSTLADHARLLGLVRAICDDPAAVKRCAAVSVRHPLGHDKIMLLDTDPSFRLRLHAWWPDSEPRVEHVHNHRFEFATSVVSGHYGMQIFQLVTTGGTLMTEYRQHASDDSGEWYLDRAGNAYLRLLATAKITPGAGYTLVQDALHRVMVPRDSFCLTLFLAIVANADLSVATRVFAPPGSPAPALVKSTALTADGYRRRLDGIIAELAGSG
jgi:endonuclease/exonuclease/phosphatase family metal-dependent hydrolase